MMKMTYLPDPPEERHDNARSLSEDVFSCIFHHDDLVIGALYFLKSRTRINPVSRLLNI